MSPFAIYFPQGQTIPLYYHLTEFQLVYIGSRLSSSVKMPAHIVYPLLIFPYNWTCKAVAVFHYCELIVAKEVDLASVPPSVTY